MNKNTIKEGIKYLLENCYFTIGNTIFRQIIGIPMGTDPAPFMTDLYLYKYESGYLKRLKKVNLRKARKFGNVFRFIDDLDAMNDGGEFSNCFKEIYPKEL